MISLTSTCADIFADDTTLGTSNHSIDTLVETLFLNGLVIVSYTQRMQLIVFCSLLIYNCTTFTSHENVLNEITVRTEGI